MKEFIAAALGAVLLVILSSFSLFVTWLNIWGIDHKNRYVKK